MDTKTPHLVIGYQYQNDDQSRRGWIAEGNDHHHFGNTPRAASIMWYYAEREKNFSWVYTDAVTPHGNGGHSVLTCRSTGQVKTFYQAGVSGEMLRKIDFLSTLTPEQMFDVFGIRYKNAMKKKKHDGRKPKGSKNG